MYNITPQEIPDIFYHIFVVPIPEEYREEVDDVDN
jgi:hypothetical protein